MNFDRSAIEAHIGLLHDLAAGCGNGVLILAPIWEGRNPIVQKFSIGHVQQMVDATTVFDGTWGVNLYAAYATMRANLDPGKKGAERDVEYVFAAVSDIDNDKGAQREIAVEPSYIIESSPGNFQRIYLFPKPLPAIEAKPVLVALHAAVGGDSSQKDCSHVWRVPGTLNWPTKSKLERGRSPDPVPVTVAKPCNGVRVDPTVLLALAPAAAVRKTRIKGLAHKNPASGVTSSEAKEPEPVQERPAGVFDAPDLPDFPKTAENIELLRAALPHIPADEREIWLKILAALKTLEPTWGPAARAIADWWSQKSPKYSQPEQEKAWNSLDPERPDGVTILSLFWLARENGWVDPRAPTDAPASRVRSNRIAADDAVEFSEYEIAQEFAARRAKGLRYVSLWGKWVEWTGAMWRPEETHLVFDWASQLCREFAGRCIQPARATTLASAKTRAAVESMAKDHRTFAATVEQWNADLFVFNVKRRKR